MRERAYTIGIISGINKYNKVVVYGFCVSIGETKEAVVKLLKQFFYIVGDDCDSILSDEGLAIVKGVEEAK